MLQHAFTRWYKNQRGFLPGTRSLAYLHKSGVTQLPDHGPEHTLI